MYESKAKRIARESREISLAVAYYHGRLDEFIASSRNLPPMEFISRMAGLFSDPRAGDVSNLPLLSMEAGKGGSIAQTVESPSHSHGNRTQNEKSGSSRNTDNAPKKVKLRPYQKSAIQKYWARFTPEQRSKIMAARRAKWSAEAKAKWAQGRRKVA